MSREGPPVERFVILPAQDPPLTLIGYTAGTRFLLNVAAVDELRVTIEENPNGMQLKVEGRRAFGRDPWAHRSKGMKCATCMWYVPKKASGDPLVTKELGRCRRHAPSMGGYPVVFPTDWCGDHRLDEGKL